MILNYRDNYVVLKVFSLQDITKTMENSYIVIIICLTYAYFSLCQIFFLADKTCQELQNDSISHEGISPSSSTPLSWNSCLHSKHPYLLHPYPYPQHPHPRPQYPHSYSICRYFYFTFWSTHNVRIWIRSFCFIFTDKLSFLLTKIEFVTDQFSFFYWQKTYFFTATSTKSTDHFWIVYWFFSNWPINIFTDHFNNFLLTFQLFYWPQNIFPF